MGCNAVAAKLLQPTEVSKMRPEKSLHISVMRTKCIIIFVHTHTHTHTSYRKGGRYQYCSTRFGAINCDMLQNTVFLRTWKKTHYVHATNVHTHDNHIPQCQHNPADVQYTHCQVQPFTLTKAITQYAHSPVCKHTHTHTHTYIRRSTRKIGRETEWEVSL